jgi:hypothetical protein
MLALGLLFLNGCTTKSTTPAPPSAPASISLAFEVQPAKAVPNQPVTLIAKVTGDNKPVNDANVEFEVWHSNDKNHTMLKTKRTGEGVYSITNTYPTAGTYNIIVHATTPRVHQMISKTFTIGEAIHEEKGHHAEANGVLMHIQMPTTTKSGQNTKLYGHITQNNQPLTEANVQFEIWKDGESKHDFTDTAEIKPGEYYSAYLFKTAGTYHIKLHVEKGKTHDHTEQTLVVK